MFTRAFVRVASAAGRVARAAPSVAPVSVAVVACAALGAAAGSSAVTCAAAGSDVYSWGYGQFGQLGQGDDKDRALPSEVQPLDAKSITKIASHGCSDSSAAVASNGDLYTWGNGRDGRLGHGYSLQGAPENVPRLVASLQNKVADVAVGEHHGVCVTKDGAVWSWGKTKGVNRYLLGHDDKTGTPCRVAGLDGVSVRKVSCGRHHTVVVTTDGQALSWGYNQDGVLGNGTRDSSSKPTPMAGLSGKNIVDASCGKTHTLVLTDDGHVFACGFDSYGQLGMGQSSSRTLRSPTLIQGLEGKGIVKVVAGENYSLAIAADGGVFTWGMGLDGQLGHADQANVSIPKHILALEGTRVVDASCGAGHTLVQTSEGKLLAFGRGRNGQLGQADQLGSIAAHRSTPQQINFFSGRKVASFACGANHSLTVAEK